MPATRASLAAPGARAPLDFAGRFDTTELRADFLRRGNDRLRRTGVAPVSILELFTLCSALLARAGKTRTQGGISQVRDRRDACPTMRRRNRRHDGT
jgi:hypothetical protein